jgi:hypothetical protein
VVDVGDDGDVTKVHGSSSGRAKVDARSRRKTGTHFSGSRFQNLEYWHVMTLLRFVIPLHLFVRA